MIPSETGICSICEYPFENDYERVEHPLHKDTDICQKCYSSLYIDWDNNIYKERVRRKQNKIFKVVKKDGIIKIKLE